MSPKPSGNTTLASTVAKHGAAADAEATSSSSAVAAEGGAALAAAAVPSGSDSSTRVDSLEPSQRFANLKERLKLLRCVARTHATMPFVIPAQHAPCGKARMLLVHC